MADRRRFEAANQGVVGGLKIASARPDGPECGVRYRAAVLGTSLVDVVQAAGGLMFDRMRLGWEVVTVVTDCSDERPLQILGARAVHSDSVKAEEVRTEIPHNLVVAGDLLRNDRTVRRWVEQLLDHGLTEVFVWRTSAVAPKSDASAMEHRLSQAARVFKTAALRAASGPETQCGPTEIFLVGGVASGAAEIRLIPPR
jgi:hypothetical protein